MHLPYRPGDIGRLNFSHNIVSDVFGMKACDEEIHLNTQGSSQWDGLLHYAYQDRQEYYNGVSYKEAALEKTNITLGIQCMRFFTCCIKKTPNIICSAI